jgi:DNA-binding CsgD family transcriptional regulator
MSITLSQADVARLQAALAVLVSPLDHPSGETWLEASMQGVMTVLGADQAYALIPGPAPGSAIMAGAGYDVPRAVAEYVGEFMPMDTGLHERRRSLGLEVYRIGDLWDTSRFHRTRLYNEWAVPHRLMDVLGMGHNPIPGEAMAGMNFYHDRDHGPEDADAEGAFGSRGHILLGLLLPAFKAGVRTYHRLAQHRAGLIRVLDQLSEALAIYDLAGSSLHQNAALNRILTADPERERLRCAMATAARTVAALLRRTPAISPVDARLVTQETRTARGRYRVSASLLGQSLLGGEVTVAVGLERVVPSPPSDTVLASRHGLTRRQIEVVRLAAEGRTAGEIAHLLGISRFTARHHLEAAMGRLQVRSRAALVAALRCDT